MTLTIFVNQKNAGLRLDLSNPHKYYKLPERETGLEHRKNKKILIIRGLKAHYRLVE